MSFQLATCITGARNKTYALRKWHSDIPVDSEMMALGP